MEFFTTPPQDTGCSYEMEAFACLESLAIPYQRIEHPPAETMEVCAAVSDALGVRICKNLVLCNRQKTAFYLLCMPEDKPFHTKDLSAQIGSSRLSFAPGELLEELIGCKVGSASILGLLHDKENRVQLLLDEDVAKEAYFGCHPCNNHASLRLKTSDVLDRFLPHVAHSPVMVVL